MSERLAVALYSGIVVHRDAVSDSLRVKLEILRRLVVRGAPLEVLVFTHAAEDQFPELRIVPSVAQLTGSEEFWATELHVFEFGMYYNLVDALYVIPPNVPTLVIDHNTTPPELVELPEVRAGCQRALVQRHNLQQATHVACVSEFNLEISSSVGVPDDRLSVLHLPPAHPGTLRPRDFRRDGKPRAIEALFVGRFVRSKGVLDLLAATRPLWTTGRLRLRLVGSPRFSDPEVFAEVESAIATSDGMVKLAVDLEPEAMMREFAQSDLLVLPSYHEGYCVPVIEAYSAGCHVIAYDCSNLPNVTGGLAQLIPLRDVEALGAAVELFVRRAEDSARRLAPLEVPTDAGDLPQDVWIDRVRAHLANYSAASYERGFLQLLRQLAERSRDGLSPGLSEVLDARIGELAAA